MKRLGKNGAILARRLLVTLMVVLAFSVSVTGPVFAAPDERELKQGYTAIDLAIGIVKGEALEARTPGQIANGGVDGMRLLIEEKKLSADFLKAIDKDAPQDVATNALHEQYKAAATRYPALFKDHAITMAALSGVMASVGDPYTVYLNPKETKLLSEAMSGGNFGGIGVVIHLDPDHENTLTIVSVMDEGPAAKVGLKSGDQILSINGVATKGKNIAQCSELLRGEAGSKVRLSIRRQGNAEPMAVAVTRERIHVSTAVGKLIEKDGYKIGHIILSLFGESTNLEVEKAIRSLEDQGAQAFILDVRGNAGGYVSAAIDVCSKFLKTGSRVVSTVERNRPEQISYSHPNKLSRRINCPLVVLVDKNSASASEITAGAVKDLKRGKLVGVKTYGKGSVQKLYPMNFPSGETSMLKITIAHYHTPEGHDLHKAGIIPDVVVELPKDEAPKAEGTADAAKPDSAKIVKDTQLEKATEMVVSDLKAANVGTTSQASSDKTVAVDGLLGEQQYLDSLLQPGTYSVVSRQLHREGDKLSEVVTVKQASGKVVEFTFDLSTTLHD